MVGLALACLRRPNWFLHTLQHETCHLLAAWLVGVKVHRLTASNGQGGEVTHDQTGPLRTAFIALAPYVFPLLLAPLLLARALTPESNYRQVLSGLCALMVPLHLTGLVHNIRLNFKDRRGDLAIVGRLLSLALILCALLLLAALVVIVLWDDSSLWRAIRHQLGRDQAPHP